MNIKMLKAALAGLVLSVSGFANAALIYNVDSGWQDFNWDDGVGATSSEGGFILDLLNDGVLTVVDAFAFGDEFEILLDNAFHSVTSDVATYMDINVRTDADLALSSGYSQGAVFLSAGTYTVDFKLYQDGVNSSGTPFSSGTAYFKVESISVPEPSILAIFALGIMGLTARRFIKY